MSDCPGDSRVVKEVSYEFGYGEDASHWVFRADEVELARPGPGLYAWFLRPPLTHASENACNPFRRIFAERRFGIEASAPLGERMAGAIKRRQASLKDVNPSEPLDEGLFATAFAAFSPPVYIGRSSQVRTRLLSHFRSLEVALDRPPDLGPPVESSALADTDDESAQFGTRVGAMLRSRGITDSRGLFVKVAYATNNGATKRGEYLLNRTFHPVLGRL